MTGGITDAHRAARDAILAALWKPHCTSCGRSDVEAVEYACEWPDGAISRERHCDECVSVWQPQLAALGVRISLVFALRVHQVDLHDRADDTRVR